MGIFNFRKKTAGETISTPQELDNFLMSIIRSSDAGVNVTPTNAMECPAVAASVRLLASSISQVPLTIYENLAGGGREVARDHENYSVLAIRPNEYQTSSQFRRTMQLNLGLWGNAYARPVRLRSRVLELHPIHPSCVEVKQLNDYTVQYHIINNDGTKTVETDIFHLKDFASSSYVGQSRVLQSRQAIGLALAAEKFGSLFFKNGAKSSGAWGIDGKLSEPAYKRLKESLAGIANGDSAHETPLLEEGLKWQQMGFNAKDSQLTELREHQVVEIARTWNVPLHKIQDLRHATFSNIEHLGREYTQTSLKPWACEWEDELNQFLILDEDREKYTIELDIDGFSRGDLATRTTFYNAGIQWGYMSPNEVRRLEKLPDIEGGDRYLRPVNMVYTDEKLNDETET